jgi:hypothetical protein
MLEVDQYFGQTPGWSLSLPTQDQEYLVAAMRALKERQRASSSRRGRGGA